MQPLDADQIVQQVEALLERRRMSQARALLTSALAAHPDHVELLLQAAWTDYLDDRAEESLATVTQVLAREPQHRSGRFLYFQLLKDKQQLVAAEQTILELLREYPEQAHYYGAYASLMLDALKLDKARQLAREGLRYDPDSAECLAAMTLCDFIEHPAGATSHGLQQLLARDPQSIRTLVLVAAALEDRGDIKGARRVSQELVAAQPDNPHLVAMARQFKINTHWSMLPLWPMQRYGWAGSVGVWLLAVFSLRVLGRNNASLTGVLAVVFLVYVVYSWTWPAILKRLMRA
jgi:tetratricopeptide (TPR) repeat protein